MYIICTCTRYYAHMLYMYIYIYICVCIYIYTHTHVIYIYIYVHTRYIYIYIYIYQTSPRSTLRPPRARGQTERLAEYGWNTTAWNLGFDETIPFCCSRLCQENGAGDCCFCLAKKSHKHSGAHIPSPRMHRRRKTTGRNTRRCAMAGVSFSMRSQRWVAGRKQCYIWAFVYAMIISIIIITNMYIYIYIYMSSSDGVGVCRRRGVDPGSASCPPAGLAYKYPFIHRI